MTATGTNTPAPEQVKFSDFVIKINRRGKEQTRVMLITNLAVYASCIFHFVQCAFDRSYNLLPNNYSKCKRRIDVQKIAGITASQVSDEFVLHGACDSHTIVTKSRDFLVRHSSGRV